MFGIQSEEKKVAIKKIATISAVAIPVLLELGYLAWKYVKGRVEEDCIQYAGGVNGGRKRR